jgi:hypothetical protein
VTPRNVSTTVETVKRLTTAAAAAAAAESESNSSSSLYIRHKIGNLVLETQGAGGGSMAQRLWQTAQNLADFVLEEIVNDATTTTPTTNGGGNGQTRSQHGDEPDHAPSDDDDGPELEEQLSRRGIKQ